MNPNNEKKLNLMASKNNPMKMIILNNYRRCLGTSLVIGINSKKQPLVLRNSQGFLIIKNLIALIIIRKELVHRVRIKNDRLTPEMIKQL